MKEFHEYQLLLVEYIRELGYKNRNSGIKIDDFISKVNKCIGDSNRGSKLEIPYLTKGTLDGIRGMVDSERKKTRIIASHALEIGKSIIIGEFEDRETPKQKNIRLKLVSDLQDRFTDARRFFGINSALKEMSNYSTILETDSPRIENILCYRMNRSAEYTGSWLMLRNDMRGGVNVSAVIVTKHKGIPIPSFRTSGGDNNEKKISGVVVEENGYIYLIGYLRGGRTAHNIILEEPHIKGDAIIKGLSMTTESGSPIVARVVFLQRTKEVSLSGMAKFVGRRTKKECEDIFGFQNWRLLDNSNTLDGPIMI